MRIRVLTICIIVCRNEWMLCIFYLHKKSPGRLNAPGILLS